LLFDAFIRDLWNTVVCQLFAIDVVKRLQTMDIQHILYDMLFKIGMREYWNRPKLSVLILHLHLIHNFWWRSIKTTLFITEDHDTETPEPFLYTAEISIARETTNDRFPSLN